MRANPRRLLLVLFTIIAAGLSAPFAGGPTGALADPPCNPGTHWDNIRQMCVLN
jgi:hypothetical protein